MSSMNSSLATADRATHVRVIVLARVGASAVMMVGLGARARDGIGDRGDGRRQGSGAEGRDNGRLFHQRGHRHPLTDAEQRLCEAPVLRTGVFVFTSARTTASQC